MARPPERANISAFLSAFTDGHQKSHADRLVWHRGRSSLVVKKKEKKKETENLFSYTTVQLRNVYLDSVDDADCLKHASF